MAEDPPWKLTTERLGAETVLRPFGALDLETAAELRTVGTAAIRAGGNHAGLVVDLAEVSFMDSTGLGVLVTLWHEAQANGGRFRVSRPSPPAARVLGISGVDTLFETS
jgi:anti-anti-sigma factor